MRELSAGKPSGGGHPAGETQNQPFHLSFNASLSVDFQWLRVTSDGGLILIRELDERLGFGELIEQYLTDSRMKNARLPFADLLRQSVYSRLAGYEERCCKSGLESRAISGCAGADGRPSGVLPIKIVSQCREQARRVYYGAVFEIKKEIPAWGRIRKRPIS
jgi:hypothetical protein